MANIFIYDEFGPEDTAMMQALYSRSPKSVTEHVEKVKASGSGKFMETFYIGYGHASIADCGSTTIFIEGLSILADKAIQDSQMYSGQETSTRYVDMGKQPVIDPLGTDSSKQIIANWMEFYNRSQEPMQAYLMTKYPRQEGEDETMYVKAIKARAFDITRGFLPAGITTQLSWHTNLRQAWDKLALLRFHPLSEVREIADGILAKLQEKYAHSFNHPLIPEQEQYREYLNQQYNYFLPKAPIEFAISTAVKDIDLLPYQGLIDLRPPKTGLPTFLAELGTITFDFLMDYGSFRDIQRHRHGVCRMPLLTTNYGFNAWYLEQLPEAIRLEAEKLLADQRALVDDLDTTVEIKQYYIPLGYQITARVSYGLPAAVYVIELRSGKPVHPTLRKIAHRMREELLTCLPSLKLYCDLDPDDWDVRRGLQDIIKK